MNEGSLNSLPVGSFSLRPVLVGRLPLPIKKSPSVFWKAETVPTTSGWMVREKQEDSAHLQPLSSGQERKEKQTVRLRETEK